MGVVVVASLASLLLPDDASHVAAVVMIAALVGLPVLRVGWLATRWLTLGDWRFAGVAFGLLLVVASGAVLAFAR